MRIGSGQLKNIVLTGCFVCIVMLYGFLLQGCFSSKVLGLSEILERTQNTYKHIETISGRLDVTLGSPEPGANIIIGQMTGHFCHKRITADTSLGWYIANEFFPIDEPLQGYKVYYNGDSLINFELRDSSVTKKSPCKADSDWGFSTFCNWRERIDLYRESFILPDSVFQKKKGAWLIGNISLGKDTVIEGRACYMIECRKESVKPEFQVRTINFEQLAIDKEYYYPVYYRTHFQRFVNDRPNIDQVCYRAVSDLQLNKVVSDSVFVMKEKGKESSPKSVVNLVVGDLVPDWKLPTVVGDSLSLYEQRGKRVILFFSYAGCGACGMAMGEIKRDVLEVCDRNKFTFIYVDPVDSFELMKKYAEETKVDFPMVKGTRELAGKYGISGYPQIFFLDEKGSIIRIFSGHFPGIGKAMRKELNK